MNYFIIFVLIFGYTADLVTDCSQFNNDPTGCRTAHCAFLPEEGGCVPNCDPQTIGQFFYDPSDDTLSMGKDQAGHTYESCERLCLDSPLCAMFNFISNTLCMPMFGIPSTVSHVASARAGICTSIPDPTPAPVVPIQPSVAPSRSLSPTLSPIFSPSNNPSLQPSQEPSDRPSVAPTFSAPSRAPTTETPTTGPTGAPSTDEPTNVPTISSPSTSPSKTPSQCPTSDSPSQTPSSCPTSATPTTAPSQSPSFFPTTDDPSVSPTWFPTSTLPSKSPSINPTVDSPSRTPSMSPSSEEPSVAPTHFPTSDTPTNIPSVSPTLNPSSDTPSQMPTRFPTSDEPTNLPSINPTTDTPSRSPSHFPTTDTPSKSPSTQPTQNPTSDSPTTNPSVQPTQIPTTDLPTTNPSVGPTQFPTTDMPTRSPSRTPSTGPTSCPTTDTPSRTPSTTPSTSPTVTPSQFPTTDMPSRTPSRTPSVDPTTKPTKSPTKFPTTEEPSVAPTQNPTTQPTTSPTDSPTGACWNFLTFDECPTRCAWDGYGCHENCNLHTGYKPPEGATGIYSSMEVGSAEDCEFVCINDQICSQFVYDPISESCTLYDNYHENLIPSIYSVTGYCNRTPFPSDFPSKTPTATDPSIHPTSDSPTNLPSKEPSITFPSVAPTLQPSTIIPTANPSTSPSFTSPTQCPSFSPSDSNPTTLPTLFPTIAPTQGCYSFTSAETCPNRCVWDGHDCLSQCRIEPKSFAMLERSTIIASTIGGTFDECEVACIHDQDCSMFIYHGPTKECQRSSSYTLIFSRNAEYTTGLCNYTPLPTIAPSSNPSFSPSKMPSSTFPTSLPTSDEPTNLPSSHPSSAFPSKTPSYTPTYSNPTTSPSGIPSNTPTLTDPSTTPSVMPSANPTVSCFSLTDYAACRNAGVCVWDGNFCSSVCLVVTFKRPIAGSLGTPYEEIMNTDAGSCEYHCIMDQSCSQYLYYTVQRTCWLYGAYTEDLEDYRDGITGYCHRTPNPTTNPTSSPSKSPSVMPTGSPSFDSPTQTPSTLPTVSNPSNSPSAYPTSENPTSSPSSSPSVMPTSLPTIDQPTIAPSRVPTSTVPSVSPSKNPTTTPSNVPSTIPTSTPSSMPTSDSPTTQPTGNPTIDTPTISPTQNPTSDSPSLLPSEQPSNAPSGSPSTQPTGSPSVDEPTVSPSMGPSKTPSRAPSSKPTRNPTVDSPSLTPSTEPSNRPSALPSISPTVDSPSQTPSEVPTVDAPSSSPSVVPSVSPTFSPTTDCEIFNEKDACRGSGCLWSEHTQLCYDTCSVDVDVMVVGTHLETPFDATTLEECEARCREDDPACVRYAYWLGKCFLFSSYTGERNEVGAISGFCLHTAAPTPLPTEAPSHSLPSTSPSKAPSPNQPTQNPTVDSPSQNPTSESPTASPSKQPSLSKPSQRPTVSPSKTPSTSPSNIPTVDSPTVSPSVQPSFSPITTRPSRTPSMTEPSMMPSSTPSTSPSLEPSNNCLDITTKDKCLSSSCSWLAHLNTCAFGCAIENHTTFSGTELYRIAVSTWQDCESTCLEENGSCFRFTFYHGQCLIYGPTEGSFTLNNAISGNCHVTQSPSDFPSTLPSFSPLTTQPSKQPSFTFPSTNPTLQPSATQPTVTPTESPTFDCNLFEESDCRISGCAWLHHNQTCTNNCHPMPGNFLTGNYESSSAPDQEECEIECLEKPSCVGFTFWLDSCLLFDVYELIFEEEGAYSGICVASFEPTALPTKSPSTIPTSVPSMAPTALPSDIPSTDPSLSPSLTNPSLSPSTTEPSELPSALPISTQPSIRPSATQPSVQPSFTQPSTTPTESPTYDCALFDESECRPSGCAWLHHLQTCTGYCHQMLDFAFTGTYESVSAPDAEECEILCLEKSTCVSFTFWLNSCLLFDEYESTRVEPNAESGLCVASFEPTDLPTIAPSISIPTSSPSTLPSLSPLTSIPSSAPSRQPSPSQPSVSPTESPTYDCNLFEESDCRISGCAWLHHNQTCANLCQSMESVAFTGTSETISMDDPLECQILCLEKASCVSFTFWLNHCLLFDEYETIRAEEDAISGICVASFEPTSLPTLSPSTPMPSKTPTISPSMSPSSSIPSDVPTMSPGLEPTTNSPSISPTSDSPTALPSNEPTFDCSRFAEEDCRINGCAWLHHNQTCADSCDRLPGTALAGDSVDLPSSSYLECEELCLERPSCHGFTYYLSHCLLYDEYLSARDEPDADSAICVGTHHPTPLPTLPPLTSTPTLSPSTTSPSKFPISSIPSHAPISSIPSSTPTKGIPTNSPSQSPITSTPSQSPIFSLPTQEPTTSCDLFDSELECRQTSCVWLRHNETCTKHAEILEDSFVRGQSIGTIPNSNFNECEEACLEKESCVIFTVLYAHCLMYSTYDDIVSLEGAISGVCLGTHIPTHLPTLSPSTTPTIAPTLTSPSVSPSKIPTSTIPSSSPSSNMPSIQPSFTNPSASPTKLPSSTCPTVSPIISIPTLNPLTSMPSSVPSIQPSVKPSPSPSGSPTSTDPTTLPTTSPSFTVPSTSPSAMPTPYPSADCTLIDGEDVCRDSGCLWNRVNETCHKECTQIQDVMFTGQELDPVVSMSLGECEEACRESDPNCIAYSFYPGSCRLFSSFEGQISFADAYSGWCILTNHPTQIPTQSLPTTTPSFTLPTNSPSFTLPSVSPTVEDPTSSPSVDPTRNPSARPSTSPTHAPSKECTLIGSGDICRASGCAWLPHNMTCHATCLRIEDTMTVGEHLQESPLQVDIEECEELCLETQGCIRFSHFTTNCFLYSSYSGEAIQTGATTGACEHTFQPTSLPSRTPTSLPSAHPISASPTTSPSKLPSSNPTSDTPSNMPTISPSSETPTVTPSANPTISCSTYDSNEASCRAQGCAYLRHSGKCDPACSWKQGIEYSGLSIENFFSQDFFECQERCLELTNCLKFTLLTKDHECWIWEEIHDEIHNLFASSGSCVETFEPTPLPTTNPSISAPSTMPTRSPSISAPTQTPSVMPSSEDPSVTPTRYPTTEDPTALPTDSPTTLPSKTPSKSPSNMPSLSSPTITPSQTPSVIPTFGPSTQPSEPPSITPTISNPTKLPSIMPSPNDPTLAPSLSSPTGKPTASPLPSCHTYRVSECPTWCVNTGKHCTDRCEQHYGKGASNPEDILETKFQTDDGELFTLKTCEQYCIDMSFGCQQYEFSTIDRRCRIYYFYSTNFIEDKDKITGLCSRTAAPSPAPLTSTPTESPTTYFECSQFSGHHSEPYCLSESSCVWIAELDLCASNCPTKPGRFSVLGGFEELLVSSIERMDDCQDLCLTNFENPNPDEAFECRVFSFNAWTKHCYLFEYVIETANDDSAFVSGICESLPTTRPTTMPTDLPTVQPTYPPSSSPSLSPSFTKPTVAPSHAPSTSPTSTQPSVSPSFDPSRSPTYFPSESPTQQPSFTQPSVSPSTTQPSTSPSCSPSSHPSFSPTAFPTLAPTWDCFKFDTQEECSPDFNCIWFVETQQCGKDCAQQLGAGIIGTESDKIRNYTVEDIKQCKFWCTTEITCVAYNMQGSVCTLWHGYTEYLPSLAGSVGAGICRDTPKPTEYPTNAPTNKPTQAPIIDPSVTPSRTPSHMPSVIPSASPLASLPTTSPTVVPSSSPSVIPTELPSFTPSVTPTVDPSLSPSKIPSGTPSVIPTYGPTSSIPTVGPSKGPTTSRPTFEPSVSPSTTQPTTSPTVTQPSCSPSLSPTASPTEVTYATLQLTFHCHYLPGLTPKTPEEMETDIAKAGGLYPLETRMVTEDPREHYYSLTVHTRRPEELKNQIYNRAGDIAVELGCSQAWTPHNVNMMNVDNHCMDEATFNCTVGAASKGKTCSELTEENLGTWCVTQSLGFSYACCACNDARLGYRGGYMQLGPNGTEEYHFTKDSNPRGQQLDDALASDIKMGLEDSWTISGWVRGQGFRGWDVDFEIIKKCAFEADRSKRVCYGLGIRESKFCFIWSFDDGREETSIPLDNNPILYGWSGIQAEAQAALVAFSYDNGFIQPWFNQMPLQAFYLQPSQLDCLIYENTPCDGASDRRSLVDRKKYQYHNISIGSDNSYWVADFRYYDSSTDGEVLNSRFTSQKIIFYDDKLVVPEPTTPPGPVKLSFAEEIIEFSQTNFYIVLFPFLIWIAGTVYNKVLNIGPMKNIPVLVFCFSITDTILDVLFTVKLLGDDEVTHLAYSCASFIMGPIIINCVMFMTCIREKWSQGNHRNFRKNFGSVFFCLVATGGSMTSLQVLGSSLFADRKVFTSFPYLYIDDLPTYNILKIIADIGFSGVHVLYVLQKEAVDLFVMASITTSCIGLCYAISIFFGSLIASTADQVAVFRMSVYCHVDKPAARQNRVNNAIKSEYFSRHELRHGAELEFDIGEELLEQLGDKWLRVQFVEKYSTTQCKVRVMNCSMVERDPNLQEGAIRLPMLRDLKRVQYVQRSLMPEVQLSTSGVCMDAVIYVHGPSKDLTWHWNWREAEQALEYGLQKAFPTQYNEDRKETLYFVAIHPKRNNDNKFGKPFNDLMLQFLEELLEDHEGFEGARQAIHEVWDDQIEVKYFDLDKREFRRVWEVISLDKKSLYRANFGNVLTGRKGYHDNPALLKFIRQLATYTKTRMDQYAIEENDELDGDQLDGYDDHYGGARFLEMYHERSGSIATPFGLSNSQQDGYDQLNQTVRALQEQVEMANLNQNPTSVQGENTPGGSGAGGASYTDDSSSSKLRAGGRRKSNLVNIENVASDWSKEDLQSHEAEILRQMAYLEAVSSGDEGTQQGGNWQPGGGAYNHFDDVEEDSDSEYVPEEVGDSIMGHHDEPFSNEPFSMDDNEGHYAETRPGAKNRAPGNQVDFRADRLISETSTYETGTDLHDEFSDPEYFEDDDGTYYSSQYGTYEDDIAGTYEPFGGGLLESGSKKAEAIKREQQRRLDMYNMNHMKSPGKRNPYPLKRGPSGDFIKSRDSNAEGSVASLELQKSPKRPKRNPNATRTMKRGPSKAGLLETPVQQQYSQHFYEHEPSSPSGNLSPISSPSTSKHQPIQHNTLFTSSTTSLPKPSLGKSSKLAVPGGRYRPPGSPGSNLSSSGGKAFPTDFADDDESSVTTESEEDIEYFNAPVSHPNKSRPSPQTIPSLRKPNSNSLQKPYSSPSNPSSNHKKKEYENVNLYQEDEHDSDEDLFQADGDIFGGPEDVLDNDLEDFPSTYQTQNEPFSDADHGDLDDTELVMEYYPSHAPDFHVSRSRSQDPNRIRPPQPLLE